MLLDPDPGVGLSEYRSLRTRNRSTNKISGREYYDFLYNPKQNND